MPGIVRPTSRFCLLDLIASRPSATALIMKRVDKVLRDVATRLKSGLSDADTLSARRWRRVYALLDRYKSPRDLTDIADRLLKSAATPF